jgi:hypothetical protein
MAAACGTRSSEAAAHAHGSAAAFGGGQLGVLVAYVAITCAVIEQPPLWLDKNAYFLALSVAFFAGVAHVMTASVLPADRVAAAVAKVRRQAALEVAHGSRLGLLAASTAVMLLAALGDKQPPPGVVGSNDTAFFLAVSGAFFAGVAQVAASVSAGDGGSGRPRDAARKLVYASLVLVLGLALLR